MQMMHVGLFLFSTLASCQACFLSGLQLLSSGDAVMEWHHSPVNLEPVQNQQPEGDLIRTEHTQAHPDPYAQRD